MEPRRVRIDRAEYCGVSFEDKGERGLKGVSDAVRVWAVR